MVCVCFFQGKRAQFRISTVTHELVPDTTVDAQSTYNVATYENAHYNYFPNIREKPSGRLFGTASKLYISYLGYQRKRLERLSLSSWLLCKISTRTMVQ